MSPPPKPRSSPDAPYFVTHESFQDADAAKTYNPWVVLAEDASVNHMTDDVTREYARRMHYAAYRTAKAADARGRATWREAYLRCRDRVVLGNCKLVYRAVRRWMPPQMWADDMIGDCHVVLIQAVAAYNPWLGIRFSTYAFTCLMRALSRLSQRHASDRLAKSLPLDALAEGEPRDPAEADAPATRLQLIDEFLRETNGLLSAREKKVLMRRYRLDDQAKGGTLEQVGRELGLSKERVRQVQASALDKLRKVLADGGPAPHHHL